VTLWEHKGVVMTEKLQADLTKENWETVALPADFPRFTEESAVPGAQPKLVATLHQGKFYMAGCSPPELYSRWEVCEDLALQLKEQAKDSKVGKRSHMTEVAILEQYLTRLIEMRWTSMDEAHWVIRRVADLLHWPVPVQAAPLRRN